MSLEAESLLGDACDFQSEIELVIAAFSAEYENDIPHLLKGLSKIFYRRGLVVSDSGDFLTILAILDNKRQWEDLCCRL